MLFSATSACPKCLLRFERRERCPECGGTDVGSLATFADRGRFRRQMRAAHPELSEAGFDLLLMRLGEWAPTRTWIPLFFGALLTFPLFAFLAGGRDSFLNVWVGPRDGHAFAVWREGLSPDGAAVIFFGVVGVLLMAISFVPRLAARAAERRVRAGVRRTLRVFVPRAADAVNHASLRGILRLGSEECVSPVAGTRCVVYGVVGTVAGTTIDDADGGDFDIELEGGERVLVSLEHAVLRTERPLAPAALDGPRSAELDEFLDKRGVATGREQCELDEIVLCDGDEVEVEGALSGSAAVQVAYRGSGPRVISGTPAAPLILFPTKRRRA